MLESLNYSVRNPKNIIWVIYRIKQLRNYKKNHEVLRGPQLDKQRWQARLGILRVNDTRGSRDEQKEITNLCLKYFPLQKFWCSSVLLTASQNGVFLYGDSRLETPVAYVVPVRNESSISGILDKMIQDENCALLGHYAASSGNSLPTFRETHVSRLQGPGIQATLEDGTDRLSQNFGKELPFHSA